MGIITGTVAVLLAGIALGQLAFNPSFRGRGMAIAALVIGLADVVLWGDLAGIHSPQVHVCGLQNRRAVFFPLRLTSWRERLPTYERLLKRMSFSWWSEKDGPRS